MDIVTLPILPSTASPAAALHILDTQRCTAFVVEHDSDYSIVFGEAIQKLRHSGKNRLSETDALESIPLVSLDDAAQFHLDIARPHSALAGYRTFLGKANKRYVVVKAEQGLAVVVTAHEYIGNQFASPGRYRCNGPITHYFPLPYVSQGEECPRCIPTLGAPTPTVVFA